MSRTQFAQMICIGVLAHVRLACLVAYGIAYGHKQP